MFLVLFDLFGGNEGGYRDRVLVAGAVLKPPNIGCFIVITQSGDGHW
jgi:hypothetical protein